MKLISNDGADGKTIKLTGEEYEDLLKILDLCTLLNIVRIYMLLSQKCGMNYMKWT